MTTESPPLPMRYEQGIFIPQEPIDLPVGTRVRLTIELSAPPVPPVEVPSGSPPPPPSHPEQLFTLPSPAGAKRGWMGKVREWLDHRLGSRGMLSHFSYAEVGLLLFTMFAYAITRFIGLQDFPMYFFCDEAIQPVLAQQLLKNGFRDADGVLLPTYFFNADKWSLSLTVYLHLISVAIFGKSVLVTRATSVVVGMLAPLATALMLKLVFKVRSWWLAPLALAAFPAWFIHSRTAFETAMMVAFYAGFLCSYLLYRMRDPRYLIAAVAFGGATFFSYTNGQGVMLVSGVLLLLFDFPYHLRRTRDHPRIVLAGMLVAILLAIPLMRFKMLHPEAVASHLGQVLDSYWFRPDPLHERLATFLKNYSHALDPRYWFLNDDQDPERFRHRLKGMSHAPLVLAPCFLIGLGVCFWRWRSPPHRTMLVAMLAAPFASALAWIAVYRCLAMVIPITVVAIVGFETLLALLARWRDVRWPLTVVAALILLCSSGYILTISLRDGPTWYDNYGLAGTQYGARQLFGEAIPAMLAKTPESTSILVSLSWANNPGIFISFFLNPIQQQRVHLTRIDSYLISKQRVTPDQIFVLAASDYELLQESKKIILQPPEHIIPYPNGQPGFYFVRMRYADNADALFAADEAERNRLMETTVTLDGQPLTLRHSPIDMGDPQNIFDGNAQTLMRGKSANPFLMEFDFPEPRTIASFTVQVRAKFFHLKIIAPSDDGKPRVYQQEYRYQPLDPRVTYTFPDGPITTKRLRVEIYNPHDGIQSHVHVWEVVFHAHPVE